MIRRLVTTVCSLAAGAVLVAAQGTTPPPAGAGQGQQPTFRSRIDSISVDVTVTDKQGRPVTDLKPEEFEIREANKPQTIDTFRLIAADPTEVGSVVDRPIVSLADHRRETEDPENRLIVVFLDDYHVRKGNGMVIREHLARWVSTLGPRDLVAILYPLTSISALTFSRNHDGTALALMRFEGRKYDYNPKNDYERQFDNMPPEMIEQARNELTIRALTSACIYLGGLREGRKTVLYVSEGMVATLPAGARTTGNYRPATGSDPSTSQAFFATADLISRMRDIFSAATRNNTSVFTLDPRGLAPSEFGVADNVSMDADRLVMNEAMDSLRTIADQTDGRAILNRNNPGTELQKMVRELSAYYLLGYTSTIGARDGKFHPIQVRVKRPGVEVRHRKGYWAFTEDEVRRASTPPKAGPPTEVANALEELASVVEPSARRGVSLWIGSTRGAAEKARVTLTWEAAAVPSQDPIDKVARISLVATSGSGQELFKGPVEPDPAAGRVAGRVSFDAPPGLVKFRLTTENASGQRIENEDATHEVPDFTGAHPIISTPVVYRARTAREITLLRSSTDALPAVTRQFSRTERLLVRFDAYGPAGTTPKVTIRLLNKVGESLATFPDPTLVSGSTFDVDVTLGALPPGDYLLEITAASATESTKKLLGIKITG
jgi:VWFA-related protein